MNFKSKFANNKFNKISIDNFIEKYRRDNPQEDLKKLREDILYFKQLKIQGIKCDCGNSLWVIGSAISGKNCFTCITGDSDFSRDYEIE
jgi:hypothetical protein